MVRIMLAAIAVVLLTPARTRTRSDERREASRHRRGQADEPGRARDRDAARRRGVGAGDRAATAPCAGRRAARTRREAAGGRLAARDEAAAARVGEAGTAVRGDPEGESPAPARRR